MQQFYVTHLENEDKPQETKVSKESKYIVYEKKNFDTLNVRWSETIYFKLLLARKIWQPLIIA